MRIAKQGLIDVSAIVTLLIANHFFLYAFCNIFTAGQPGLHLLLEWQHLRIEISIMSTKWLKKYHIGCNGRFGRIMMQHNSKDDL